MKGRKQRKGLIGLCKTGGAQDRINWKGSIPSMGQKPQGTNLPMDLRLQRKRSFRVGRGSKYLA